MGPKRSKRKKEAAKPTVAPKKARAAGRGSGSAGPLSQPAGGGSSRGGVDLGDPCPYNLQVAGRKICAGPWHLVEIPSPDEF